MTNGILAPTQEEGQRSGPATFTQSMELPLISSDLRDPMFIATCDREAQLPNSRSDAKAVFAAACWGSENLHLSTEPEKSSDRLLSMTAKRWRGQAQQKTAQKVER